MKKPITYILLLFFLFIVFLYFRYRSEPIENTIGLTVEQLVAQYEYLPHQIDTLQMEQIDRSIRQIIKSKSLRTSRPILRYSTKGGLKAKEIFWLIDSGDGYKVIHAIVHLE